MKASELAHEAVSDRGRVVGHGGSSFFGVAHVHGGEACGHMFRDGSLVYFSTRVTLVTG